MKERLGESLPSERAMGREFTKRKSDGVRVHQKKERWDESSSKERAMGWEFTMKKRVMG